MVLRHTLDLSSPEVARIFGVDHTTVLAACLAHEAYLASLYKKELFP